MLIQDNFFFFFLLNSDYLVQRRGGLKINVNESELVEQATKGGARGVISLILSKGFVLTRYADSFAISLGVQVLLEIE